VSEEAHTPMSVLGSHSGSGGDDAAAEAIRSDPVTAANQRIGSAIYHVVSDTAGPDAFERRDLYPGANWMGTYPKPLPGLAAAVVVLRAARKAHGDAIALARGTGESWAAIAEVLGLIREAERVEMSAELAGWRYAAMGVHPDEDDRPHQYGDTEARWRCWTCHQWVYEASPEHGLSFVERERGHGETCARRVAAVAEERARWEAEDA
jgi:hypothetical protein